MDKEFLKSWYREFKATLTEAGVDFTDKRDLMRLRIIMPEKLVLPEGEFATEGYAFIPKKKNGSYAVTPPAVNEEAEYNLNEDILHNRINFNTEFDRNEYQINEIAKTRMQRVIWEYNNQYLFDENRNSDLAQIEHLYNQVSTGHVLLQGKTTEIEPNRQIYLDKDNHVRIGPSADDCARVYELDGDLYISIRDVNESLKAKGITPENTPHSQYIDLRIEEEERMQLERIRTAFDYEPKIGVKEGYNNYQIMTAAVVGQYGQTKLHLSRIAAHRNFVLSARYDHPEYFNADGTYTDLGFENLMPVVEREYVTDEIKKNSFNNVFMELYNTLNAADPAMVRSHKEFRDLKAAVKDLAEHSNTLSREEIDAKINNAITLSNAYLRSKQKPDVKLSDTTFKRIEAVSRIRNKLLVAKDVRLEREKEFEKRKKYDAAGTAERNQATQTTLTEKAAEAKADLRTLMEHIRAGELGADQANASERVKYSVAKLMSYQILLNTMNSETNQMTKDKIEALSDSPNSVALKLVGSKSFEEFYAGLNVSDVMQLANEDGSAFLNHKIDELNRTAPAAKHNNLLVASIVNVKDNIRFHKDDEFFYESVQEGMDQKNSLKIYGLNVDRSARNALAVAKLLKDGYSMEDILDPYKLYQQKQQAGKAVLDHLSMSPKNLTWIAEQLDAGTQILTEKVGKLVEKLPDQAPGYETTKEGNFLTTCAWVLQNIAQERDHSEIANEISKTHKISPEEGELPFVYSNIINLYFGANNAAAQMLIAPSGQNVVIATSFAKTALLQKLNDLRKLPGGIKENVKASELSPYTSMKAALGADRTHDRYMSSLTSTTSKIAFCNDVLSGDFAKKHVSEAKTVTNEFGLPELHISLKPNSFQPKANPTVEENKVKLI